MESRSALEIFVRVVETRSFAKVARELGLTQPTVSRQIAGLEAQVGVQLLTRTTRRVEPTELGWAYYRAVCEPLAQLREAAARLKAQEGEERGWVRVAAPGALGRHVIAPQLMRAMARWPGLQIELRLSDTPLDMVAERIDLAVRVGMSGPQVFRIRRLGSTTQRLVGTPQQVAIYRASPLQVGVVLRRSASGALLWAGSEALGLGIEQARLVVDDVEMAYEAIVQGLGLGLLPQWLIKGALERGQLEIAEPDLSPAIHVSVLIGHDTTPRRVQLVLDSLSEALGEALES